MMQNTTIDNIQHRRPLPRGAKTIRIPCNAIQYQQLFSNQTMYRLYLDELIQKHPELFPASIINGYYWHDLLPSSIKLGIQLYRIKVKETGEVYTICPSYVMPYMTGFTKDVEKALFLQRFGVPYWALTYVFGKDDMHWYRMATSFGRCSIVGTTVKDAEKLPLDLVADEKHTSILGEKVYGAMTVGGNCILGASLCEGADETNLTEGYKVFKEEAHNLNPSYEPETVNVDGWDATTLSWRSLFPTISIMLCFLHAFLSVRNVSKKAGFFDKISEFIWDIYKAEDKKGLSQKIRRLREWATKNVEKEIILKKILLFCGKANAFKAHYDHPDGFRTSNMVDRLMRWADRYLFSMQYFHGTTRSAKQGFIAWAILRNFQPYCSRVERGKDVLLCAASELNGFSYHKNWLENLIVSISMNGYRQE